MLTDKVKVEVTVGVGPEPALSAVEPGAVLVPARKVPEGHRDVTTVDPLPVVNVIRVPHGAHPVLAVGVTSGQMGSNSNKLKANLTTHSVSSETSFQI